MKTCYLFFVIALLLSSLSLQAQTPRPIFGIEETMKTLPGKRDEYMKAERGVFKKLHQERVKRGLILGWDLYAVRLRPMANKSKRHANW
ncbi:hypothetical protein [Spirosoma areae]